ncbi:MAG TPA: AMP-binding protein [Methylomirabilota bacterium]|nr:AMP-binding protein [Methylomirabilota bacterium]
MGDALFRSRHELAASQLDQLRALLTELLPANRFYARKLGDAGVGFDVASLADYERRFPLTTKAELVEDQRLAPPYGTNLTHPLECYTRFHQTSGTTGAPLRWLDTPESWDWMVGSWTEVFRAAGATPADRVLFAFSFGPFIGFWLAYEAAERLGCLCVPGGGMSSSGRLRLLLDNAITVLCCTPTYALRLAEVAAEEGFDLSQGTVRTLVVAGEPGGSIPATRARIESLWPGARVFDHHGMTEVGPVTHECPAQPGRLHVIESAYLAEVIDPETGRPVSPGATGELLLTTLGRMGSPLLRYRTGDLVRPSFPEPCACGRYDMALEGGILGRADDMVVVRGVNIFPSAVEDVIRAQKGIAEYEVRIERRGALSELAVRVEPSPEATGDRALVERLERALQAAFSLRVPVTVAEAGSLPRFEMKARRWIRT